MQAVELAKDALRVESKYLTITIQYKPTSLKLIRMIITKIGMKRNII